MSSVVSGFTVAVISNPIDVVRTRLMTFKQQRAHQNALDCFIEIIKIEGIKGLCKGFGANWMRAGAQTTL